MGPDDSMDPQLCNGRCKIYCVYKAQNEELIREHGKKVDFSHRHYRNFFHHQSRLTALAPVSILSTRVFLRKRGLAQTSLSMAEVICISLSRLLLISAIGVTIDFQLASLTTNRCTFMILQTDLLIGYDVYDIGAPRKSC